ncbi:MAG: ECF transporter S component [Acidaminobacteraceae bacterium]
MTTNTKKKYDLSTRLKITLLGVIAFIIMFLELPIPIFPVFLKIDVSDVPALIAGFALGPVAGVLVGLLKNVLHLLKTSTMGVGELANFLVGAAIVIPSSIIYRKDKSRASAIKGLLVGSIGMALMGAFANYFILIPFYEKAMGFPVAAVVGMGSAINSAIVDLPTFILYAIVPFNLLKGIVVSVVTVMLYKYVSPLLNKGLK